jgi:hypothetical protein
MAAIVTDQFRIFNASNFISSVDDTSNSYYVFLGLPNPAAVGFGRTSDWNTNTPNPIDNFDYENEYHDTMMFGKKITSLNTRRLVRRIDWASGTKYEMYRNDYSIVNQSPITKSSRLYDANYYVMNSDYRVYICIDNGSSGINPTGNASQTLCASSTVANLSPTGSSIKWYSVPTGGSSLATNTTLTNGTYYATVSSGFTIVSDLTGAYYAFDLDTGTRWHSAAEQANNTKGYDNGVYNLNGQTITTNIYNTSDVAGEYIEITLPYRIILLLTDFL